MKKTERSKEKRSEMKRNNEKRCKTKRKEEILYGKLRATKKTMNIF